VIWPRVARYLLPLAAGYCWGCDLLVPGAFMTLALVALTVSDLLIAHERAQERGDQEW
jgi:hypothetical protein